MASNRPGGSQAYQGYPYTNPAVQDIPSVSAEEAAKWSRLPRKPAPLAPIRDQPGGSGTQGATGSQSTNRQGYSGYPYARPAVHEIPTAISAQDAARWNNLPRRPAPSAVRGGTGQELSPMVFVEEPVSSGSQVSERREVENDQPYVQDTIFYDQFKDRRIGVHSGSSSGSSSIRSGHSDRPPLHMRPNPPSSLDLNSPESAFGGSSSSRVPPFMSKQTDVYGQFGISNTSFDGVDFPEPPPAYSETDISQRGTPATPAQSETVDAPMQNVSVIVQDDNGLTRTQVIIPSDNSDDPDKRFIECTGCGFGSYGLVVKQSGLVTHIIACIFVFVMFPVALLIYYTDFLKYKNYYCRQCNKLVAYQGPFCCQDLEYF